jgi:hypothetical protein
MKDTRDTPPAGAARHSLFGLTAPDERRVLIAALARDRRNLTPAQVRQLRRALFEDEGVSRDEARALFDLDRAQGACCPEWTAFFVERLTDHVVWQTQPAGLVELEQAEWLLREASAAPSLPVCALLANVLAEAHRAPRLLIDAVKALAEARGAASALARAEYPRSQG